MNNPPEAPAICQQPLTLLTPWWTSFSSDYYSCAPPAALLQRLQTRDGVVYFAAQGALCALDAHGIHRMAVTSTNPNADIVKAFWIDSDRLIYADTYAVYAVPLAGGDSIILATFAEDVVPYPREKAPYSGAFAFDGTFVYYAAGFTNVGIFRVPVAGGAPETVLLLGAGTTVQTVTTLGVAGDRLDIIVNDTTSGIDSLTRLSPTGHADRVDLSSLGSLLASVGDLSYVRYPRRSDGDQYDDSTYDLGVIGADVQIASAWTVDEPQFMPNSATVHGDNLYVGGRLHYKNGSASVGVTASAVGATSGQVLGCFPIDLPPNQVWTNVAATAADDDFVYAMITRPNAGNLDYAIARFPHP